MRWAKMNWLILCVSVLPLLMGVFHPVWAGEVVLHSIQIKKPIAVLLEINGYGELKRNGKTYTINAAGAGFRKGDVFGIPISGTGGYYAVIALNRAAKEKDTSYVRLEEGAKIVFLDDDGKVAITGVYVESTTSSAPSSLVFYINHASHQSPFFVWTPDLVVGVRGTYFEVRPADAELHYKTQVIGYNAIDGSEIERLDVNMPGAFKPEDLSIIFANKEEIIDFLKDNLDGNTEISDPTGRNSISVDELDSNNTNHVIAAYYYMSKNYAWALKEILNDSGNPFSLGVDITKTDDSVEIEYETPKSYFDGFLNKIFSNTGVSKPVVVDADISSHPLYVTYLMTDNPSCVSDGGRCTYKKYKIGPTPTTTTLYDVLVHNQNIADSAFKDLLIGLIKACNSFFSSFLSSHLSPPPSISSPISVVTNDEIKIFGCTYEVGWFCNGGTCNILNPVGGGSLCSALSSWILAIFSDVLQAIKVEYFVAIEVYPDQSFVRLKENSDTVVLTKPGVVFSIKAETDSSGKFVYPIVKVKNADPVPEEKRAGTLEDVGKHYRDVEKRRHKNTLEKFNEKVSPSPPSPEERGSGQGLSSADSLSPPPPPNLFVPDDDFDDDTGDGEN